MEQTKDKRRVGIIYALTGGTCWGLSGCFGQYLFQEKGITAEWLVTVRLVFAGILLILLGLLLTKKRMGDMWKDPVDRKSMVLFALAGMLTCQYTYFAAIQHSNAGTATVLQSLGPVVILGYICLKEKRLPRKLELGAMLCGLFGVFLLSTHGDIRSMSITTLALIFGLGAAVSAAAYNLLSGNLLRKYGVYAAVGYAMFIAGIAMLIVVRPWTYDILFDRGTVLATAGVVVIGTALAFSLYLKGVSLVGPFMGSLLGMVEPVTAIIVSLVFLGASFHIMDLAGFVLILGTVVALSLRSK
ncbi:EamA family transporter [Anaerotignum sp.]|nr:DMT family transporter [Anaerotignum sp.]MBQ7759386.1 EamA family transporter [Anaerotignum sp.]